MKTKKGGPWATIVVLAALLFGFGYILAPSDRIDQCRKLKPGVGYHDMVVKLGLPVHSDTLQSAIQLHFRSNRLAAGPIRAKVDMKSGLVLELCCTEDDPCSWSLE